MFVIGTAGHIDHGKSVLVHALTGIDPDRLREEKARGMTIDLGFAWLKLPSGQEVGIVDVPGHERFIKNMLAGVGGIDLALLIVAANEGVMPQTREHLAILDLLEVRRGVVVITKKDIVDDELLSLVKLEIDDLIRSTTLSDASVVAVSAVTGDGLANLVSVIDQVLMSVEPRKDIGRPRLSIDRAFTIAGSGTVVTGTLVDGSLSLGQEIEVLPSGVKARLRGLQTHKSRIDIASPGSRLAANLAGVSTSQIERGDVLTTPGWLIPTIRIDVKLRLLPNIKRPLRHGAVVSLHTGSTEVMAKLRLLEKEDLKPGDTAMAQFTLTRPAAVVKGDHFIIRSPMVTLGGGNIVDSHTRRHKLFRRDVVQSLSVVDGGTKEEVVVAMLEMKQPMELETFLVQCNLSVDEAHRIVNELIEQKKVVAVGQGDHRLLFTTSGWEHMVKSAKTAVEEYHRRFPARTGMPGGELSSKLRLEPNSQVLQKITHEGILIEEGSIVRLPAHRVELTSEQKATVGTFLESLNQNPYSPPGDITIEPDLLNLLIERREVVRAGDGVVFSASAYDEMVDRVVTYAREHGNVSLADVRDMLGTSRKYAKALLEYMDEKKITRRVGDERILREKSQDV